MKQNSDSRFLKWLATLEGKFDTLLGILSMLAVATVVSNEMISPDWTLPWVNIPWVSVGMGARAFIWLVFVANFVVYCLASRRPVTYVRSHMLELIVCLAWIPHYHAGSMFNHSLLNFDPLPVDLLQLIGTIAHAWRTVRFTAQRFNSHPLFVTGSAAVVVVTAASALLNHFEPQTFKTFWDALWYSLATVTTIGYGDIVPHTAIGRVIGGVLILSGISIFAVFVGLTSELVRERLLAHHKKVGDIKDEAEVIARDQNRVMVEVLAELKTNNELLRKLIEETQRANSRAQEPQKPSANESAGPCLPEDKNSRVD